MTVSQEKDKEQALNLESVSWGDLTWLNIEQPTIREIEYLAQNYSFHPLDLDDCLSRKQRPKIDEYKDYLFHIFHFTVYDKETWVSTHDQVSVFVGEKYLITIHNGRLKPLAKLFRECQINEEARRESFSYGSGFLLYCILDRAVDAYFPILDKLFGLMENVEDRVFDENVESAQEVAMLRRNIITQRRIMFPVRTVTSELEGKLKRFSKIDMSVYFGDLLDHMNKICETLDECKDTIEVFKDADYVLGTERLNRIIRVLTILSSITIPFIAIASIYGMNVALPGGMEKGSLSSFIFLLGSMLLLSGGMLYFFRHKRWI